MESPSTAAGTDRDSSRSSKLVRDLTYVLDCALLVDESTPGALTAWSHLRASSDEWLAALEADPRPLEAFMTDVTGRLQGYYTAMLQFWLSHSPQSIPARQTMQRVPVSRKRLALDLKLVATLPGNQTCLYCDPNVFFAIAAGSAPEDLLPGNLVSVELESNLLHKQMLGRLKCGISQAPLVRQWLLDNTDTTELQSSVRVAGAMFTPLTPSGPAGLWWCDTIQQLLSCAPDDSLWAVVDQRHFLSPAVVKKLPRNELHFTRGLEGTAQLVPVSPPWPRLPPPEAQLSKGLRGAEVKRLQLLLVRAGLLAPSKIRYRVGVFGENTKMAVGALQCLSGIPPTGIYCTATSEALCDLMKTGEEPSPDWLPDYDSDDGELVVEGCMSMMIPHALLLNGDQLLARLGSAPLPVSNGVSEALVDLESETRAKLAVHHGIWCDVCNMHPIRGARYMKQLPADTYDVCQVCYSEMNESSKTELHRSTLVVTPALTRALEQLQLLAEAEVGTFEWSDPMSEQERMHLHAAASAALHVGHLTVGNQVTARKMVLWKWAPDSGTRFQLSCKGGRAQWEALVKVDDKESTLVSFRGDFSNTGLSATAPPVVVSGEMPCEISKALAKVSFGWDEAASEWSVACSAGAMLMCATQLEGCFAQQLLVAQHACVLTLDTNTIRTEGSRDSNGRNNKRDPLALIQVVQAPDGSFSEASRGFLLPRGWHQTAAALRSDSEPRCKQQLQQFQLPPGCDPDDITAHLGMMTFSAALSTQADAILNSNPSEWKVKEKARGVSPVKPKRWAPLAVPAEVDGSIFLAEFDDWKAKHNLGGLGGQKKGRGLLHSSTARKMLLSIIHTVDAPYQLLVDILLVADLNNPEVLQLTHAVVGAMTSKAAVAALHTPSEAPHTSKYTGLQREMQQCILSATVKSLTEMIETLETDGSSICSGLCRLPLKPWDILTKVEQRSVQGTKGQADACNSALKCLALALSKLHGADRAYRGVAEEQLLTSRTSALGVATEMLLLLDHSFASADATELIHWLVRGAEWAACEQLATTSELQQGIVDECLSLKNTRAAAKYADMFHLASTSVCFRYNGTRPLVPILSEESSASLPYFSMPSCIPVVYVCDSDGLIKCVEELKVLTLVALDAEWKPFRHESETTPVALLQIASTHCVWLLDLLQLSSEASLGSLWETLQSHVTVVGFGLYGDLQRLVQSFPGSNLTSFGRAIELQGLVAESSGCRGLDAVCRMLLHCGLDKRMQTSDWSCRPLSAEQLQYAAADAYVLLLILSVIVGLEDTNGTSVTGSQMARAQLQLSSSEDQIASVAIQWVRHLGASRTDVLPSIVAPLTKEDVKVALCERGLDKSADLISLSDNTDCVQPGQIVAKTIALIHQDCLVMCVLALDQRLQLSRCAAAIGARRCDLRMAKEEELVPLVGYPRGAIGPVGLRTKVSAILLDQELASEKRILCGAGEVGLVFEISGTDLLGVSNLITCAIHA